MNEERVVHARISANLTEVVLEGTQPALKGYDTFDVEKGDTLKWVVQGAPPAAKVRVRFVGVPGAGRVSPFADGCKVLEASAGVIVSGAVAGQGPERYAYAVELVEGDTVTNLACFWSDERGQTLMSPMGGGVESGGPP